MSTAQVRGEDVGLVGLVAETLTRGRLNVRIERTGRPEVKNLLLAPKQFDPVNRDLKIRVGHRTSTSRDVQAEWNSVHHGRAPVGSGVARSMRRKSDSARRGEPAGRMAAFALPVNLVDSVHTDRSPGRDAWLAALPGVVAEFAERWSLRLGPPYQPGGRTAWVAPARDHTGRDLVLKVAWAHDEALHEADGLRAWTGHGTVHLYDSGTAGASTVLLLERCRPGSTLGQTVPESEQDQIVAGLLRRLWQATTCGHRFRPLQAMCDNWASEFDHRLAAEFGALDRGLVRAGLDLWRTLPATSDRQALLCTDLHAGNILAAEREPWLVIDPKPYLGDPAYDALQHLLNCDRLTADPVGLAHRMADLLDLDHDRLLAWLFARCVLESLDQPQLSDVATRLAP